MKKLTFLANFMILFLINGSCLLFNLDYNFYTKLTFNIFKPPINFFTIFNLVYVILISISIGEVITIYKFNNLNKSFIIKLLVNFICFNMIRVFFNMHFLFLTFLGSISLFISLIYIYEEVYFFNEKSTRYLDINVLYSLILSAFTFCLYFLNN